MAFIDLRAYSRTHEGSPELRGYLATPAGAGPWPGVVMVHEAFGLNDVQTAHADRLAEAGFLTLAVDLFTRGGTMRCLVSTMRAARSGQGIAYADIASGRAYLLDAPDCTGKVGVIGFCMGGAFALMLAGRGEYDVAAPNYGQLPEDLDAAMAGACPIVGSYGGRDNQLKGSADRLAEALTKAGVEHDIKEYPTAGHAFLNETETGPRLLRPLMRAAHMGPDPESAPDAWHRIETFMHTQLD